jgi:hypothetical protein
MRPLAWFVVFAALVAAACASSTGPQREPAASAPEMWIDAPLDGAHLPLAELDLIFSGWAPTGGIEGFEYSINGETLGQLSGEYQANQSGYIYAYTQTKWTPPAPGTYTLELRGVGPNGPGEPAVAQFTICADGQAALEDACEAATPQPEATATHLPAPLALTAVPSRDVNCRQGPSGSLFDIVDILVSGSPYTPQAQGPDGLWLLFHGPDYDGDCWAVSQYLDLFCDDAVVSLPDVSPCSLQTRAYPALPTLTPTAVFTPEPSATAVPECNDGIDNDRDGSTDMRDRDCTAPSDNSE